MEFDEFSKRLGLKIKYYRMLKGLTQTDVANILNIDEKYLSQIENGHINITIKTLHKFIGVLGVDGSKLLDFSD